MRENTPLAAGIDTAKDKLDIAVHGHDARLGVRNDDAGWRRLEQEFARLGVRRVGIEASGGYERGVVDHLRAAGITVLVLQPLQSLPRRRPGSRLGPKCICAGPRTTASMPR